MHVEPGVVETWEKFCSTKPPCSIALDGFVDAAPCFNAVGPYANFDHHKNVNRLATRSTAGQILVAIFLGLFETFQQKEHPFAHVYINDCDQDICLSYWLLSNAHLVSELSIDLDLVKLIIGEDLIDSSGGAFPINPNQSIVRKMAWVFEYYDEYRFSKNRSQMTGENVKNVIERTCERITLLYLGKGKEIGINSVYQLLGGGSNWQMIIEEGTSARTKLFNDGIRAFVAVRERDKGIYDYSIGRMSPFINFPIEKIYDLLNNVEGRCHSSDRWGGSDTIGGSPRKSGSQISPHEIEQLINRLIAS